MRMLIAILLAVASLPAYAACRDPAVKHKFDLINGYHHGRPGYIVDHICALAQGGIDDVSNMQYQTIAESHAKDRIENTLVGKAKWCTPQNSTPTRQVFNCKGESDKDNR